MPKYLIQVSYTAEGAKGVQKDGGTKRRKSAQTLVESVGGRMEAFYFAFGASDVYVIADMPDNVSAASAGLTLAVTGAVTTKTTALLTVEDIDAAVKKTASYRAPGQ